MKANGKHPWSVVTVAVLMIVSAVFNLLFYLAKFVFLFAFTFMWLFLLIISGVGAIFSHSLDSLVHFLGALIGMLLLLVVLIVPVYWIFQEVSMSIRILKRMRRRRLNWTFGAATIIVSIINVNPVSFIIGIFLWFLLTQPEVKEHLGGYMKVQKKKRRR